jgi:hypothetical protein
LANAAVATSELAYITGSDKNMAGTKGRICDITGHNILSIGIFQMLLLDAAKKSLVKRIFIRVIICSHAGTRGIRSLHHSWIVKRLKLSA